MTKIAGLEALTLREANNILGSKFKTIRNYSTKFSCSIREKESSTSDSGSPGEYLIFGNTPSIDDTTKIEEEVLKYIKNSNILDESDSVEYYVGKSRNSQFGGTLIGLSMFGETSGSVTIEERHVKSLLKHLQEKDSRYSNFEVKHVDVTLRRKIPYKETNISDRYSDNIYAIIAKEVKKA